MATLRQRTSRTTTKSETEPFIPSSAAKNQEDDKIKKDAVNSSTPRTPNSTYWLTTLLILRSIAFIYCIAFSVAYFQNTALIGVHGIYPYPAVLDRYASHYDSNWDRFVNLPTFLWFLPRNDKSLQQIALCGVILSSSVIMFGHRCCHCMVFLSLWLLYHSLVNVGQLFYGYGWESQLLETGFIAIFLCRIRLFSWHNTRKLSRSSNKLENNSTVRCNPFLSLEQTPPIPPSRLILMLFLWLSFRIMLGAGLIKIRAGGCWLDYTCMDYHYETQPNPSPLSWIMHNNPHWFHELEVAANHFAELIAPWFLLIPIRRVTIAASIIQVVN